MEENYTNQDLEDSLRRAFVEKGFESILLDGHEARSSFKRDGINYGLDNGWLCKKEDIEESQYTAVNYALTEKGKKYFGLSK